MTKRAWAVWSVAAAVASALVSCSVPEGVFFHCGPNQTCLTGFQCVNDHCYPDVEPGPDDGGDAGPRTDGGSGEVLDGGNTDDGGSGNEDGGETDAGSDAGPAAVVPVPLTWVNARPISELNTIASELMPTITPDGLKLCFVASISSPTQDVHCAERSSRATGFAAAQVQPQVMPGEFLENPELTTNGLDLLFSGPDAGYTDLYRASFRGDGFEEHRWIGHVASDGYDLSPSLTGDGLTLYFVSDRSNMNGTELWMTTRDDSSTWAFKPPVMVTALNSSKNERDPAISPDGGYLVFTSDNRDPTPLTGAIVWLATREEDGGWKSPQPVALEGITTAVTGVDLTADDQLVFSTRPGGSGDDPDLYVADPKYPPAP